MVWAEQANPDDEPGIALEGGGGGFAGWDPRAHTYTRYRTPPNEHYCRFGIPSQIGDLLPITGWPEGREYF